MNMKKLISVTAVFLLLAGSIWVVSSCNKDTDTPTTTVTSTEEEIISTTEDGAIDRGCSPCPGTRAMAGEATNYSISIHYRTCPTDAWSLAGTWNQTTWPIAPNYTPFPISIHHAKTYKITVTNNSAFSAYFQNIKIFNTGLLTNFQTGALSIAPGNTYSQVFAPIANCGCGWIYNCPGPGHDEE